MFVHARRVAAALGVAVAASAFAVAAQQPSSLVPRVPSDSARRVVTALGIERDARSLGAAQQTIQGDSLTAAGETNLVQALAGRVAGGDVSGTGASGASTSILLRGGRTPSGSDQPLFVVDGVPLGNSSVDVLSNGPILSTFASQIDAGSTIADVDPNDVQTVTVLDGPNAAALYGFRAQNGAILITTKSAAGTRGFGLTARQDFTFESPTVLPRFQSQYALGSGETFGTFAQASWGPRFGSGNQVQWWSNGQAEPLVANPDALEAFLDRGHTTTTTAAVTGATSRSDVRLGITNMDQDGLEPGSHVHRIHTSLDGGINLLPRLRVQVATQYSHADLGNVPVDGVSVANPLDAFLELGSSIDLPHLRDDARLNAFSEFGTDNPYWDEVNMANANLRDHVTGSASAAYAITPWLSASIRTGIDWWHDRMSLTTPEASFPEPDQQQTSASGSTYKEQNSDLVLSAVRPLTRWLTMSLDAGLANRSGDSDTGTRFENEFGDIEVAQLKSQLKTNSVYGRTGFAFDSALFVDATARKDWTEEGPVVSPSASAAYIVVRPAPRRTVSSAKLRLSWAQIGSEDPVFLGSVLDHTISWEAGTDLGLWRDRLTFSTTYYDERTRSHYGVVESGAIHEAVLPVANRGVEVAIGGAPVNRTGGIQWNTALRFGANRSRVEGKRPAIPATLGNDLQLVPGQPYGAFSVFAPRRDSLGRMILEGGFPDDELVSAGSELPSWVAGLENDVRY